MMNLTMSNSDYIIFIDHPVLLLNDVLLTVSKINICVANTQKQAGGSVNVTATPSQILLLLMLKIR